ncbi:MAG: M56 family metallopeptidase [Bacteroidota bacterium]|nr:M56 family metallopeptidase [Bacteroidota bacterium]
MNTFLIYILESTICISLFYLLFRLLMRKETSFAVNRATLLTIVAASVIVPLVQLPQLMQTPVHVELIPEFSESKIQIQNLPGSENAISDVVQQPVSETAPATNELTIPLETLLRYFYLAGVLVALLLFIRNIVLIFLLSRKATVQQMDCYRLLIVDREVPSFAFGRSVVISQTDYEAHGSAILAHEQAHIRQNHFVDLLLLELVRTIHWFNPAVHALIGDMKEIHEFQADEQTLHSGIDATQYQLLVIQKGVGPRRFVLANSFNHCQIKKRITMMNKQKTSKAWRWKVATFLPLLALLLMAFGNRSEKVSAKDNVPEKVVETSQAVPETQSSQSGRVIEIRKDGNYIDNKLCTLDEIVSKGKEWGKASNDWIHLRIDESIPYNRIDEIGENLRKAKVYHITQSSVNSDEVVYPAGDVSSLAKFTQGSWSKWSQAQLKQLVGDKLEGLEYSLITGFIIDKNGKVRDARLIKKSDYPEINAAYEKVLTNIPD